MNSETANPGPDPAELHAFRRGAPLPGPGRLAPQRARLLALASGNAPRPVPRQVRRRVFVAAGVATAVAAVVAGGLVALPPGHGDGPADRTQGDRALSGGSAAAVLELAADTVAKRQVTEPGPKQWVYDKSVNILQGHPQTSEAWTRWDGTGAANLPGIPGEGHNYHFNPKKLQVWYGPNQEAKWKKEGYDDRSQRQFWDFLVALPSDPDAMMKAIRDKHAIGDVPHETPAQRDWREIGVLFRSVLIPPNVQAGMYRALAKIPGAHVEKGVKDPLGRPAIGVWVEGPKTGPEGRLGKDEFFLDPKTYAYLGERLGDTGAGGTAQARAASGVVDNPGQRP